MPRRVAERLTQLALKCSRLSRKYRGHEIAAELETLAAELAEEASKLDQLFKVNIKAASFGGLGKNGCALRGASKVIRGLSTLYVSRRERSRGIMKAI